LASRYGKLWEILLTTLEESPKGAWHAAGTPQDRLPFDGPPFQDADGPDGCDGAVMDRQSQGQPPGYFLGVGPPTYVGGYGWLTISVAEYSTRVPV
jgi:hypothetical protein